MRLALWHWGRCYTMQASDSVVMVTALFQAFPKENTMAYTLKRPIAGLSFEDIKRIYDNNPSITLHDLSNITGYAIPFLKRLLTTS